MELFRGSEAVLRQYLNTRSTSKDCSNDVSVEDAEHVLFTDSVRRAEFYHAT